MYQVAGGDCESCVGWRDLLIVDCPGKCWSRATSRGLGHKFQAPFFMKENSDDNLKIDCQEKARTHAGFVVLLSKSANTNESWTSPSPVAPSILVDLL